VHDFSNPKGTGFPVAQNKAYFWSKQPATFTGLFALFFSFQGHNFVIYREIWVVFTEFHINQVLLSVS